MKPEQIILIDDNRTRRQGYASFLGELGMRVETRDTLPEKPASREPRNEVRRLLVVAIADARSRLLPGLAELKQVHPSPSVIALISSEASGGLIPFIEHGIIDQITPPDSLPGLYAAIKNERLKADLSQKAEAYLRDIRQLRKEQGADLRRAMEIEEVFETTLENFMAALDLRDVETFGHSKTVARYSQVLAEALGLRDATTLHNIRKGALLHDAGKIAIPDAILKKPGPLTAHEWEKIKRHPALGYGLIKDIKLVREVGNIILYHHEKYDGTGYPKGLASEAIPLESRIFAVADTLDAITSHRPYRNRSDFASAKKEIIQNTGTQFDPRVVDAFCGLDLAGWEKIQYETVHLMPAAEAYRHLAAKA